MTANRTMVTVALIRPTLTALALLIILFSQPHSSAAFVGYLQHQKNVALHKQRQQQLTVSSLLLAIKNTDGNNNEESKRTYTKIDDGSPLGVAIVAIGGLLYSDPLGLFSGVDNNNNPFLSLLQQDNSAWIIILTTASTAAGLERLVCYMSDKQQQ